MTFKKKRRELQWFDDYIIDLIAEISGFDKRYIIPKVAYKSDHSIHNEFDCFDFYYKDTIYGIEKGKFIPNKYN